MKILFFYFLLLSSVITPVAQPKLQEINAVLHDESYVAVHGHDDNHSSALSLALQKK